MVWMLSFTTNLIDVMMSVPVDEDDRQDWLSPCPVLSTDTLH